MEKKKSNFLLIAIIVVLVLYSGIITYQHVKAKIIERQTQEKIDKQLIDHGINPDDFHFDE